MGRVEESVFGLTSQKKKKKGERGAKKLITHIQTHTHTCLSTEEQSALDKSDIFGGEYCLLIGIEAAASLR